eukprot:1141036-Pelagomonas_calceolata.AAC.1
MGHSLLTAGHGNGQAAAEMDLKRFAEPSWDEDHYTILEPFFENVALEFFSSTGFVQLQVSTTRLLSATVSSRRFSTLTSALEPERTLVKHHTSCLRWMI